MPSSDATPMRHVDASELQGWITGLFTDLDLAPKDAGQVGRMLVRTSLRGIDTHGVKLAPLYAGMLMRGEAKARAEHGGEFRGGTLFYHGDRGLAQVTATTAMTLAIEYATDHPIVPCLMDKIGYLGALGVMAMEASDAGMLAFICQSTSPYIGLPGFNTAAIGNNPIAFAAPFADRPPLVFDMAVSVAARGRLVQALQAGEAIPQDWALAPGGAPTTDAAQGLAGMLQPVGGYKGLGLAMLVQCLTSSLLGISATLERGPATISDMGAFALIINPGLASGDAYPEDMAHWLGTFAQAAGPAGRYPGERAAAIARRRETTGIPIDSATVEKLRETGRFVGRQFLV